MQFVTTKGMQLQDFSNYPYCLAHPAIMCPTGQYGSVGGVCTPCSPTSAPSVPEQMQCVPPRTSRRRLLSNMQVHLARANARCY